MTVTLEHLEFYFLILVRISAFITVAPFFHMNGVPATVKAGFSLFLTIVVASVVPYEAMDYVGTLGFTILIVKELVVGLSMGYFCTICTRIISFAGQIIDMEMGFSMASLLDPISNSQVTVTGNLLYFLVILMLLVTNLHHYIVKAIADSFIRIPLGEVVLSTELYRIMVKFMTEFFIIGFRIVLPVFSCILIINIVLGILAKVSPQMNMFVVGFQLKIMVGFFAVMIIIYMLPQIGDFLFQEMKTLLELLVNSFAGT